MDRYTDERRNRSNDPLTLLHPEILKSGDRIHLIMEEYIFPDLEKIGFTFKKSPLMMTRKSGEFEQEIVIQKNHHNHTNQVVAFLPNFCVKSKTFAGWRTQKYGIPLPNTYIDYRHAHYIDGWSEDHKDGSWYDFATHDNKDIVSAFKENIAGPGLTFLEALSDPRSAITYIMNDRYPQYHKAPLLFDFALWLNDKTVAGQILEWFKAYYNTSDTGWSGEILRDIEMRRATLKSW